MGLHMYATVLRFHVGTGALEFSPHGYTINTLYNLPITIVKVNEDLGGIGELKYLICFNEENFYSRSLYLPHTI